MLSTNPLRKTCFAVKFIRDLHKSLWNRHLRQRQVIKKAKKNDNDFGDGCSDYKLTWAFSEVHVWQGDSGPSNCSDTANISFTERIEPLMRASCFSCHGNGSNHGTYSEINSGWWTLGSTTTNSLSIGFDIETGGHVFQLHFSNSTGIMREHS